jgi:hypothetical protein
VVRTGSSSLEHAAGSHIKQKAAATEIYLIMFNLLYYVMNCILYRQKKPETLGRVSG